MASLSSASKFFSNLSILFISKSTDLPIRINGQLIVSFCHVHRLSYSHPLRNPLLRRFHSDSFFPRVAALWNRLLGPWSPNITFLTSSSQLSILYILMICNSCVHKTTLYGKSQYWAVLDSLIGRTLTWEENWVKQSCGSRIEWLNWNKIVW